MSDRFIWSVIAGMAVLNFVVRFVPVAVVSRMRLPDLVMRWLSFIPVSVIGALVALELVRPGGEFRDPLTSPYVWASVPVALAYLKTRSVLVAMLAGLASFVVLRALLGG